MTTSASTHLFWITSRAAGITALLLSSASVSVGLVMAGRLRKGAGADRRVLHEVLALSMMVALLVHALSLLGDQYLRQSVLDVSVPFVSSYKTLWMTIGIIGGWGLILLGLGYYARRWIGPQRFKVLHRFVLVFWIAGLVHSLGEGTDAGQLWFLALVVLATAPALVLLVLRVAQARRGPGPATRSRSAPFRARDTSVVGREVRTLTDGRG
jgi:sulfoxide reductase heme-binding subunit YedZ